ncbi:hypothetical protein [Thalassoglobus sp.]|uniref:hypothetical protein n=1 Tax=Thalassoglobus sp. TaxID=2795869 RepID=UPI003AA7EDD2
MRSWNLYISLILLLFGQICWAQPAPQESQATGKANSSQDASALSDSSNTRSHAVIESARYEATFQDGDLTAGTFHWDLLHRGEQTASINISDVNLAFRNLTSNAKPAVWGTTKNDTRLVVVRPSMQQISGDWSKHGKSYPGTHIFECQFPRATHTELVVSIPNGSQLVSSVGHVSSAPAPGQPDHSLWTVDLGRHQTSTIRIVTDRNPTDSIIPKVTIDTIHVARQDGIFVQCHFLVDGLTKKTLSELEFLVPTTLVVQTVSSSGISLPFERDTKTPGLLRVTVPGVVTRGRLSLRIQGFQPVRWVRPQRFPVLKLRSSLETKRTANIRIESPLELHNIQAKGFFQTGLTNEPRGEVWRFEAFEESPQLIVDLGPPNYALRSEIHSLHYLDTPLPWVVSKISSIAKSGRMFTTTISIPEKWVVVAVDSLDLDSEVSSWSVEQRLLSVTFKEPISAESSKTIEILARTEIPEFDSAQPLPVPVVQNATTKSIRSDWILPEAVEIDLTSTNQWNEVTTEFHLDQFWQKLQRRQIQSPHKLRSFFSSNANLAALPDVRLLRATGTRGGHLSETDSDPASSVQQETETSEPSVLPTSRMSILTQAESLDHPVNPKLVHHATIEVFGQTTPEQLQLRLPENCLLSAVSIDGRSVTVYRDGERIRFPKGISAFSEVSVIYISTAEQKWLRQQCNIPLPVTELKTTQFEWSLELPTKRTLTSVTLPDSVSDTRSRRYFFGPFSNRSDSSLDSELVLNGDVLAQTETSPSVSARGARTYHFHCLTSAKSIQFESWDESRTQNVAWAAFLACLLIGTGGRLLRSSAIRRLSPYWLLILISFQLISVNEWSLIGGAMLIGSFLSVLLPVEFLRIPENQPSKKIIPNFATVSLFAIALLASSLSAQDVSAQRETVNSSDSTIPYLLRVVRYELIQSTPSNLYRAHLEVLTPVTATETLVELKFQGVVFQSGAECLIDGKVQSLIPSIDGQGVIVKIHNTPDSPNSAFDAEWERHTVEFDLNFRQEASSTIRSSIPRIIDATLTLPEAMDVGSVTRMGQVLSSQNDSTVLSVGPVHNFAMPAIARRPIEERLNFYTLLNISSARITGQLYLEPVDAENFEEIVLQLPPKLLVSQVAGQSVAQWFQSVDENGERHLVVESKNNSSSETIVVSFSLPILVNQVGELVVPKLDWSAGMKTQVLGLKTPPGISVEPVENQPTLQFLMAEAWPQNDAFGRSRPVQILEMKANNVLRLRLAESHPESSYSAYEKINVSQSSLEWSADVDIEIQRLPTFVHEFQIDGGVRINSVRSRLPGEETVFRFHQKGDRVSVFIPGGQLGLRKLELAGEGRFSSEIFRGLPELRLNDSKVNERSLTILDKTNWDIELKMPGGTTVTELAMKPEEFNSPRTIGTFRTELQLRPTQIRLQPPPSATRVDVASRLHVGNNDSWTLVQLLRFSGEQTPLKSVTFSVPMAYENVRISPSYFRKTANEMGNTIEYTIQIPERFSDGVSIQVSSRFPDEMKTILEQNSTSAVAVDVPRILISSARTASQFFFMNENRTVAFPSAGVLEVQSKNLPEWIPLQWKDAISHANLHGFQLLEDSLFLSPLRMEQGIQQAKIQYSETAVWPQVSGELRGVTRLWVTGSESVHCPLPFQPSIELDHVYLADGTEIPILGSGGERSAHLDLDDSVSAITVHWTSEAPTTNQIQVPLLENVKTKIPHLLGVVETGDLHTSKIKQADTNQIDIWIFRWKSLLEISKSLQSPLPVESALQKELRECQGRIQEIASKNVLTLEQSEAIERYREEWASILKDLTISVDSVTANSQRTDSSFSQLFDVHNDFQNIQWVTSDQSEAGQVQLSTLWAWPQWLLWFSKILVVCLAGYLFIMFHYQFGQLAKWVERNSPVTLLAVAIFWFLFLDPQIVSFVCVCLALFLYRNKVTGRTSRGANDQSASTQEISVQPAGPRGSS